jgi:hypothetical protein
MPYIKAQDRNELDKRSCQTAGELNYSFTCHIKKYIHTKGESYQTFNDIVGALEGAKLEFYRRIVGPYENKKIKENGDAY